MKLKFLALILLLARVTHAQTATPTPKATPLPCKIAVCLDSQAPELVAELRTKNGKAVISRYYPKDHEEPYGMKWVAKFDGQEGYGDTIEEALWNLNGSFGLQEPEEELPVCIAPTATPKP